MENTTGTSAVVEKVPYEEAIKLTSYGKFHILLVFVCGFCLISLSAESSCIALLLPSAVCDFNMSLSDKGLLGSMSVFGIISSCYLWGYLADIYGRRRVLIIGLSADFICAVSSSFAHTFWLFLLLRFFCGFFVSTTAHTTYAYAAEFFPTDRRTGALMLLPAFMPLGRTVLTGLAWLIIPNTWVLQLPMYDYHPWRLFVVILGLPSIVSVVLLLTCLPESPKYILAQGDETRTLEILQKIHRVNKGNIPDSYPVKSVVISGSSGDCASAPVVKNHNKNIISVIKSVRGQTVPLFIPPYLRTTTIACIVMFGFNLSINAIGLWIHDIFNYMSQFNIRYSRNPSSVCEAVESIDHRFLANASVAFLEHYGMNVTEESSLQDIAYVSNQTLELNTRCNIINDETFMNSLLYSLIGFIATVLGRYIVILSGRKNIVYGAVFVSIACAAGLHYSTTSLMVLLLSSVFTYVLFIAFGAINSTAVDIYPTQLRATAVSVILMSGSIGMASSSILMGVILDIDCDLVFVILGLIATVSGALTWFLPNPPKEVL